MKIATVVLLMVSVSSIGRSQDHLSKAQLLENLNQLLCNYDGKIKSIQFSVTGVTNGISASTKNQLTVGPDFGFLTVEGAPSVAVAFNENYAFQIYKKDMASSWAVKQVATKAKIPNEYDSICNSDFFKKAYLQIGLSDSEVLRDLLADEIVDIKERVKLGNGAIKLVFENDIIGDGKREEYDFKLLRLKNNEDNLSEEQLIDARLALGKRPVEVEYLVCTVESKKGYLVSEMQIRTVTKEGKKIEYSFKCGEVQTTKGLHIPASYTTERKTPGGVKKLKLEFQSVSLNERDGLERKRSKLPFYGLGEPGESKAAKALSSGSLNSALLILIAVFGIACVKFLRPFRTSQTRQVNKF